MTCKGCDYNPGLCIQNTYTLVIQRSAQSLNSVGVNSKNNRGYRGARNRWKRELKKYENLPKAKAYRRIFFTRFWGKGKRAYDYGNLVGGFKPLLDEIVRAGLLLDDSPKHCSEYYRQYKSPDGVDHVVVVIEDVHEPKD
jgi:hypothetical protein